MHMIVIRDAFARGRIPTITQKKVTDYYVLWLKTVSLYVPVD